jgi:hypothetical protein
VWGGGVVGVLQTPRLLCIRCSQPPVKLNRRNRPSFCVTQGNALTTAWVGDSRGVLGRHSGVGGWQAVDLTADHKPTNPKERERILRSQGRVER